MTFDDLKPRSFDLEPVKIQHNSQNFLNKIYYKNMFNWKTSLVGFLAIVAKFAETQGWLSVGIGDWILTTLTGLLGFLAADSKNVQPK